MDKKIALITGASRGIGRAIAGRLVKDGFWVIGTATSEAGAVAISQFLGNQGQGWILDVADPDSVEQLFKQVNEQVGVPLVLVNNAGITRDTLLMRMKDEDWEQVINTNLTSVYRMSKAAIRGMIKAKFGRIVNITSVVAATGNAGQANYSAAKAGMIAFSKSLAKEVGTRNITVNTVAPGFIETDMTQNLAAEHKAQLLNTIAMNRLGHPDEIAHAVAFLVSEQSSYITGETLHVNGGMFMS
jgi:3-oxoacyl-[acyl-carrier protein] reductase